MISLATAVSVEQGDGHRARSPTGPVGDYSLGPGGKLEGGGLARLEASRCSVGPVDHLVGGQTAVTGDDEVVSPGHDGEKVVDECHPLKRSVRMRFTPIRSILPESSQGSASGVSKTARWRGTL